MTRSSPAKTPRVTMDSYEVPAGRGTRVPVRCSWIS